MESIARVAVILVILAAQVQLWGRYGEGGICIQKLIGKKNISYESWLNMSKV